MTCPADGLIVAEGVHLDLGSRTLRGSPAPGLRVGPGADRVILTRGRVIGFGTGIAADATRAGVPPPAGSFGPSPRRVSPMSR